MSPGDHLTRPSGNLAALLSTLIPGWGQLRQGRRVLGTWLIGISGAIALLAVAIAVTGSLGTLKALTDPNVLLAVGVANIAIGVFRMVAAVDAWRYGARRSIVMILVLATFIALPHVVVGWTQARTYSVLTTVFASGDTTSTTSSSTTTSDTSATTEPTATSTTVATITTSTLPWEGRIHLNFLLIGSDAGPGRTGIRTDTMILASVALETGDLALFGFPRNLSGVVFSDGTEHRGILNEVYAYGQSQPDRFQGTDPGAAALKEVISGIAGVGIDFHMMVDLQAFVGLVDALGGVTMDIPEPLIDPIYPHEDGGTISIRIDEGIQELDGTEALAYVRSRRSSNDYNRMARQRCFLTAVIDQLDVARLIRSLPKLLDLVEQNVRTDVPLERLDDLIGLAEIVDPADAIVVGFGPPEWNSGWKPGGYPIPDSERISEAVDLILSDPGGAREELSVRDAETACGESAPPEGD